MSNITTFKFKDFPVRIVEKGKKKYFVIRDICRILGLSNPNRQLMIYTENKPLYERIKTPGGRQIVRLVSREDVDELLAANNGQKAAALRDWLRTEVYPRVFPCEAEAAAVTCLFVIIDLLCPPKQTKEKKHEKR